jgi:glycosyltransferase involved in cell wall biosynthesis
MQFNGRKPRNDLGVTGGRALSILMIMPRQMYFGPLRATSIDLCVRDLVSASRYRSTTKIFAEDIQEPFPGFVMESLPSARYAATFLRANFVANIARKLQPDVILVQQHLPTAAAIAHRLPQQKIVLQTHNFQKSFRKGSNMLQAMRRSAKKHLYNQLSGIIHVSRACEESFAEGWPDIRLPACVVNNGLDFSEWRPSPSRLKEVIVVGRAAPEKGILEAACAVRSLLPRFPGWRARFILSDIDRHHDYFQQVQKALSGLDAQIDIETQQPFADVKAAFEQAAIAIVPSKWDEPFGRTALEAHAGGASLISSGTGGLAEISGDAAMILPEVTGDAIVVALEELIREETLRQRLADAGALRVRTRFDIKAQAARLDCFLEHVSTYGNHIEKRGAGLVGCAPGADLQNHQDSDFT